MTMEIKVLFVFQIFSFLMTKESEKFKVNVTSKGELSIKELGDKMAEYLIMLRKGEVITENKFCETINFT